MQQTTNVTSSIIIGLIDGIRSPLILAAAMTFLHPSQQQFLWVFIMFLMLSSIILGIGHWLTLKSENQSATGEALKKEKEIYNNLGLDIGQGDTTSGRSAFVKNITAPAVLVSCFYLLGGALVLLPFLLATPMEQALLITLCSSITVLVLCGFAKARFYKVAVAMEIIRTALLPVIAIGLLYFILQVMR